MQCKMRLEQKISLRRMFLGEMEEIEKVEEKEDFDVRIFRMALPMSLSRHWKLPWLRWNSNPSS